MSECGWDNGSENEVLRLALKSKRWALLNGKEEQQSESIGHQVPKMWHSDLFVC